MCAPPVAGRADIAKTYTIDCGVPWREDADGGIAATAPGLPSGDAGIPGLPQLSRRGSLIATGPVDDRSVGVRIRRFPARESAGPSCGG
ncbi:hypothetical protein GCM10009639_37840 [Kitasatospora putterlickiae]|uniref:Uncharacterized protein n=1 Tax=Kitasatospora putterlickiae TaxID=221725 RepID=A0ABN1Y7Y4_9ACTN